VAVSGKGVGGARAAVGGSVVTRGTAVVAVPGIGGSVVTGGTTVVAVPGKGVGRAGAAVVAVVGEKT
jgi:hypothetical protein